MKNPALFLLTVLALASLNCSLPSATPTPVIVLVTTTSEAAPLPTAQAASPTTAVLPTIVQPLPTFTSIPSSTAAATFTPLPSATSTVTKTPEPPPASGLGSRLIHAANGGNTTSNYTDVNNSAINGDANKIIMVTANWNPGGSGGTYNTPAVGVWFNGGSNKWSIFNEDTSTMPLNAAFNVLIPSSNILSFVHTASAGNITSNYTTINKGALNNNPDAVFFVTVNWNPGGGSGVYNPAPIGVWYNGATDRWAVFNQDLSAMPAGTSFNVLIPQTNPRVYVHTANAGNTVSNYTLINHPASNNNPNAVIFVTANWNPGGSGGVYDPSALGVWYSASDNKWAIFNQDLSAMPPGASFNVMVFGG
ncbi:MAG: hypothetical protein HFACDABA_02369 [Anaerolineales bacterium]|nr:hypothetical protein [Anaerolineales bacterium]